LYLLVFLDMRRCNFPKCIENIRIRPKVRGWRVRAKGKYETRKKLAVGSGSWQNCSRFKVQGLWLMV
jgi:hypothetical protein